MNRRQAAGSTGAIGSSSTKTPSCDRRFSTSSAACSICASPWCRSASRSAPEAFARRRRRAGSRARARGRPSPAAPAAAASGISGSGGLGASAPGGGAGGGAGAAAGRGRRGRRLGPWRRGGAASAAPPRAAPGRRAAGRAAAPDRGRGPEHRRLHRAADRLGRGRRVLLERLAGGAERADQRRRDLGQRRHDLALALRAPRRARPRARQRAAAAPAPSGRTCASRRACRGRCAAAATLRKPSP